MRLIGITLRSGTMALALAGMMAAQEAPPAQPQNPPAQTQDANQANPGFGRQTPNDSATLPGGRPHDNSTYQKDRNGSQGIDIGWMGLLGLVGLFGLAGKKRTAESDEHGHEMGHLSRS